ncbi:hypothetical protein ASD52_22575 [Ensifer sp. Root142]|nr:hypothetical protein ASD52_22575 [Ensifer sp. Root142]
MSADLPAARQNRRKPKTLINTGFDLIRRKPEFTTSTIELGIKPEPHSLWMWIGEAMPFG